MKRRLLILTTIGCLMMAGCGSKATGDIVGESELNEEQIAREIAESEAVEAEKMEVYGDTESEESEAVISPNVKQVTITATGDCTLGKNQSQGYSGSFTAYYESRGGDYFFKGVKDVFEKDDFTLINLECVLSDSTNREDKEFTLKGLPEYAAILRDSSIEAVTLGNNHSADYGQESLRDTKDNVTAEGVLYAYNDETAIYTTEDGITVGYVSASLVTVTDKRIAYIKNGITSLKNQGVDIVIACPHWGEEGSNYPRSAEKRLAHEFIDCGADLVIGNHSHVLQGVEVYNGKVICYSLGNFCFGGNRNPADKDTMLFQQTFSLVDGKLQPEINAQIIPCTISSRSDYNDFQPTIVDGDKKQAIIEKVNSISESLGDAHFNEDGTLKVEFEEEFEVE